MYKTEGGVSGDPYGLSERVEDNRGLRNSGNPVNLVLSRKKTVQGTVQ